MVVLIVFTSLPPSLISNKALLPALWKEFEGHPNLLPAFFEHDKHRMNDVKTHQKWVRKPIFSREGANIDIVENGKMHLSSDGPYGEEGFIYQAFTPLPKFGNS